jgi:FtsP/CotA-like multicopper oxidase with cupredoxin domain
MQRREFLTHMLSGAAALGATAIFERATATAQEAPLNAKAGGGSPIQLRVVKRTIEVNGKAANVLGVLQPNGAPGLVLDADAPFDIQLVNEMDASTLIHWHGLTPPWTLDGVPDNPAALLEPKQSRRYTFPAGPGGTHWMHAHTLQEQSLLAAPLIVRTSADRQRDEQEVTILLHDFSFRSPEELLAGLNKGDASGDAMKMSRDAMGAMDMGNMKMGAMDMSGGAMDINDIEYDAYLANDRTLDDPEVVQVEKGGRVRLRIINGAAATAFTIDTGQISASLIAVDGQDIQPVTGSKFPISMGQRLDLRLALPIEGGGFPIVGLREGAPGRTGIILATPGAPVRKLASLDDKKGPLVGLELEAMLTPLQPLASRPVARKLALVLVGDMAQYKWGIEGDPLRVRARDRFEVSIKNTTMMSHPMHLHGHHFQVVGINGKRMNGALRDTVLLPSMASVDIAIDALNPGHWPLHCHHLYHMATGMMTYVSYSA